MKMWLIMIDMRMILNMTKIIMRMMLNIDKDDHENMFWNLVLVPPAWWMVARTKSVILQCWSRQWGLVMLLAITSSRTWGRYGKIWEWLSKRQWERWELWEWWWIWGEWCLAPLLARSARLSAAGGLVGGLVWLAAKAKYFQRWKSTSINQITIKIIQIITQIAIQIIQIIV